MSFLSKVSDICRGLFGSPLSINGAGLDIIRQFEGLRLNPYQDTDGQWKIGYGCPCEPNQTPITAVEAEELLLRELSIFEKGVRECVRVPLNPNQFSALVCFVYNVGLYSFSRSTMRRAIDRGDYAKAAIEFLRWNHIRGTISAGLTERRNAEKALFLTPFTAQPV